MKHLKTVFRTILLLFAVILTSSEAEAYEAFSTEYLDSVEVSLLTCQPHDEVYSLYGHTALRWHDLHEDDTDLAFNWGVFNFNAPHFVARFVFGLTDYELGAIPYPRFLLEYRHFGSMVTEQVIDLTSAEKQQLYVALNENLRPENQVYRYNYFYNNCTTKARDIIEGCISGKIKHAERQDNTPRYRDMIHSMTKNNPWSRFGNDLLLGIKADRTTTQREQEFLPLNLLYDFDHAQIYSNGTYRPLVKERRTAVPAGVQVRQQGFPLSPLAVGIVLLALTLLLAFLQHHNHQVFRLWTALLMLCCGTIGTVLFLMIFSQHPTVSINLQLLFFNPIHLVFLWPVFRGRTGHYWPVCLVLGAGFFLGGLWQHYASGLPLLALCLLCQCYVHKQNSR